MASLMPVVTPARSNFRGRGGLGACGAPVRGGPPNRMLRSLSGSLRFGFTIEIYPRALFGALGFVSLCSVIPTNARAIERQMRGDISRDDIVDVGHDSADRDLRSTHSSRPADHVNDLFTTIRPIDVIPPSKTITVICAVIASDLHCHSLRSLCHPNLCHPAFLSPFVDSLFTGHRTHMGGDDSHAAEAWRSGYSRPCKASMFTTRNREQ
jgi:hypothetical protein